jgi:hypothetical protein
VEAGGRIEPKVDTTRRTSVAEAHRRAVVAWIEIYVDQDGFGIVAGYFDIDLLPGCISVEKKPVMIPEPKAARISA